jgi:adenylate cyclase
MKSWPRPTLAQAFVVANLSLAGLLGLLFWGVSRASRQSQVQTAELVEQTASTTIGQRLQTYFDGAERAIDGIERQFQFGLGEASDPLSVEAHLFSALLDHPDLAGISLTHAEMLGFDEDGFIRVAPAGRWQLTAYRETPDHDSAIFTSLVKREGVRYVLEERRRRSGEALRSAAFVRSPRPVDDPTQDPTFATPASLSQYERRHDLAPSGDHRQAVWSDLSYISQDMRLPEAQRRVVVTALRAIDDASGHFVGIVRAGLRREDVDRILAEEQQRSAPIRLFLCDESGRLLARLGPDDPLVEQPDDALRVVPRHLPEEIAIALREGTSASGTSELRSRRMKVGGRFFLASFRSLPGSQGWRLGLVVAEDELPWLRPAFFADQMRLRNWLLTYALLVSGLILAGGMLTLRSVRRSLGQLAAVTGRMRHFDFLPTLFRSPFRDAQGVIDGLELAKTAMRALSRYVPVDLVRLLYETGREPVLGGELSRVSLLFTDIKDFTALSERLSPNELAVVLGAYLEVMTTAIQSTRGTIDKYIGDAIMAVWNVPTPCADHPRRACEAALAATAAAEALFRSPAWASRPPLVTRFGVHTDEVLVGHFGAPDRMSYTCLGDGVNLAARLESLNKQYGTTILVSDAVRAAAGDAFAFRAIDVVAVKGKRRGVRIHELLGPAGLSGPGVAAARRYEDAFGAYLHRDFPGALGILEVQPEDGPSAVLAERCRHFIESPPPEDWDGVFIATSK